MHSLCCENIVATGLAEKAEVQLAYAIGVAQPVSISVDTFGTGKVSEDVLVELVRNNFDLRPAGIIKMLDLRRPIYKQTATYGHFGRTDVDLSWERTDKAAAFKRASWSIIYEKLCAVSAKLFIYNYVGIKRRVQCHAKCRCGI